MTYQEELKYTSQLLTGISFGGAYEIEGVVFIKRSDDYMACFTLDRHVKIFNCIIRNSHKLSLN